VGPPGRLIEAIAEYEAALRIRPDPELQQLVACAKRAARLCGFEQFRLSQGPLSALAWVEWKS
jgi:hypothetical protein